jgi:hypothetical protein
VITPIVHQAVPRRPAPIAPPRPVDFTRMAFFPFSAEDVQLAAAAAGTGRRAVALLTVAGVAAVTFTLLASFAG